VRIISGFPAHVKGFADIFSDTILCGKIKIKFNRKGRKVYAKVAKIYTKFAGFTYPLRPLRNLLRSLR